MDSKPAARNSKSGIGNSPPAVRTAPPPPRGLRLYTQIEGAGPDVVLIHGWGWHGGIWAGLVDQLAARYRLTVPDLPGHGRSKTSPRYELDELAASVAETVTAPAVWLGWSLGGLVALTAALRWPERVQKLILVSATPRFVRGNTDWPWGMDEAVLREFHHNLKRDVRGTLQRFLLLQADSKKRLRLIKILRRELFRFGPPDRGALLGGLEILQNTDLRGALARIRLPVMLVHGDQDMLTPHQAAEFMADALPDARLERLPGAGHVPFLSHPQRFIKAVLAFLAEDNI